jgi:hypothetical protein
MPNPGLYNETVNGKMKRNDDVQKSTGAIDRLPLHARKQHPVFGVRRLFLSWLHNWKLQRGRALETNVRAGIRLECIFLTAIIRGIPPPEIMPSCQSYFAYHHWYTHDKIITVPISTLCISALFRRESGISTGQSFHGLARAGRNPAVADWSFFSHLTILLQLYQSLRRRQGRRDDKFNHTFIRSPSAALYYSIRDERAAQTAVPSAMHSITTPTTTTTTTTTLVILLIQA